MPISSTNLIKVIVVTNDLDRTAAAYKNVLGTGKAPDVAGGQPKSVREPYTKYKGADIPAVPMKVESVFSDNFWFEIIEPLGDNDPWADWLKKHGTSICSICFLSGGPLENDEEFLKSAGYDSIFKQEKGFEAYEYFDASKDLGVLIEVKEKY